MRKFGTAIVLAASAILWSEKRLDKRGLANYGLGDWCAPIPYERWSRDTPLACTSTACWYDAVRIASETARRRRTT